MTPFDLGIFELKTWQGGTVIASETTGYLRQDFDSGVKNQPVLMMQSSSNPDVGVLFNPSSGTGSLQVDTDNLQAPFLSFILEQGEASGIVSLRHPLNGRYLRSLGSIEPQIDIAADQANAWEKFVLCRRLDVMPSSGLLENIAKLLISPMSSNDVREWVKAYNVSMAGAVGQAVVRLLLAHPNGPAIFDQVSSSLALPEINNFEYASIHRRILSDRAGSAFSRLTSCLSERRTGEDSASLADSVMAIPTEARGRDFATTVATLLRHEVPNHYQSVVQTERGGMSYLTVPQGIVSGDGQCVIGADGHVFLVGGSNNVEALYETGGDTKKIQHNQDEWYALLANRQLRLKKLACRYVQIIIPEKTTALAHLFPRRLTTPSVILRAVEQAIAVNTTLSTSYMSIVDLFKDSRVSEFYKRTDTHLQPLGVFTIFKNVCKKYLNYDLEIPAFDRLLVMGSDMGYRFFGSSVAELVWECEVPNVCMSRQLVEQVEAAPGKHIGQRSVWRNPQAPLQQKIIAFGNSFFGSCFDQGCLGWWFSNFFAEFHLIWSPSVDYDYVALHKPDMVICQTAERFMTIVPDS
ncbi:hypothetical protein [Acetobacter sp.]|uniref:hypothetical protein n=1 Tax=Acetobacter sp. TaxID=440 RepID=UPI0039E84DE1